MTIKSEVICKDYETYAKGFEDGRKSLAAKLQNYDRMINGLEDMQEYSAYPGSRELAAHILDLSVPLKRVTPRA